MADDPRPAGHPPADVTRSQPPLDVTRTSGLPPDGTRTADATAGDTADDPDATSFLAPTSRPGSLGRLGHYEVLEVLGRGGFGVVYRAFDDKLQRVVAVKVLAPHLSAHGPARQRFLREARSAAGVKHPNVVQVYAVEEQPLPFLVMEYLPGPTLQQRLDRDGPFPLPELVRVGRQIAAGLAAAHATGLVHRDIKPSNVLLDTGPSPAARITDFGLARAADDTSLTRTGTVAGTPLYMSPEQARGETLDPRSDLFSLGSVLYALVTARPPFRGDSTFAVLRRVIEDAPPPIREACPELPDWFARIVEKLHAKDPAGRFQTAAEVADLLADCERQLAEGHELTDTSRIPAARRPPTPPRKRVAAWVWVVFALAGLFVLVCVGLPVASLLFWLTPTSTTTRLKPQLMAEGTSPAPRPPTDADRLKGEWVVVSAVRDGKAVPPAEQVDLFLRLGDGNYEMLTGGRREIGIYQLDTDRRELLLTSVGALAPVRMSYRLEDDRLRLSVGEAGVEMGNLAQVHNRVQSLYNLKSLALAAHNFEAATSTLPPAGLPAPKGDNTTPLLSWRVALLPYTEHDDLYRQFKLDEPWDSDHNKKLIEKMPKVYATPGANAPDGRTNYVAFTGPGTPFEVTKNGRTGIRLVEFTDGTVNTLLFVEAAEPVIWTKPDDLPYDPKKPLPKLGVADGKVNVAFADGSVATLPTPLKEETLRALITRNGGEEVTVPALRPASSPGQFQMDCVRCDFRPLFNGKDPLPSVNPKRDASEWKVEGGELVGRNRTAAWYKSGAEVPAHFRLRAEVKLTGTGEAGVYFAHGGTVPPAGTGVDLTARLWRPFGSLVTGDKVVTSSSKFTPNDWFRLEVIAVGRQWRVLMDGQQVAEYREPDDKRGKTAVVLQQSRATATGDDLVVRIRTLEFCELPAPPAK